MTDITIPSFQNQLLPPQVPHSTSPTSSSSLTSDEHNLLQLANEEYEDLFPYIMSYSQCDFITTLEQYIQISLVPRSISFPQSSIAKITKIIQTKQYEPDYNSINKLIHSIDNIKTYEKYSGVNYVPHCNYTKSPIHKCGDKMYILDKFLLCLKCKMIYKYNYVNFHCDYCDIDYFTEIEVGNSKEHSPDNEFRRATWQKYHCDAMINDCLKCYSCKSVLYVKKSTKQLRCFKCNLEFDFYNNKSTCIICKCEFSSEAKIYNALEFKNMKVIVKQSIINGILAKPDHVPCCDIKDKEIEKYNFYHRKDCNGLLCEGVLDKKKIVVCSKCHKMYHYDKHLWMCPICKGRFKMPKKAVQGYIRSKSITPISANKHKQITPTGNIRLSETSGMYANTQLLVVKTNDIKRKHSHYERRQCDKSDNDLSPSKDSNMKCKQFPSMIKNINNIDNGNSILNMKHSAFSKSITNIDEVIVTGNTNNNNNNNYQSSNKRMRRRQEPMKTKEKARGVSTNCVRVVNRNSVLYGGNTKEEVSAFLLGGDETKAKCKEKVLLKSPNVAVYKRKINNNIGTICNTNTGSGNNNISIIKNNDIDKQINSININSDSNINKNNYYSTSNPKHAITNVDKDSSVNNNLRKIPVPCNLRRGDSNTKLNTSANHNNNNNNNLSLSTNNKTKTNNSNSSNNSNCEDNNNNNNNNNIFILNMNINNNNNTPQISLSPKIQRSSSKLINDFNNDDYSIIKQIGEGSFGKIYSVEDKAHNKYAMKKLIASSLKEITAIQNEYRILISLTQFHLNLANIYGTEYKQLDKTTYVMYVLMDLALYDWEKEITTRNQSKTYYSEKELIQILKELTNTFAELQKLNISHRDIKPQNILVFPNNSYRIADFGEAKEILKANIEKNTSKQTIRGTELYMSPILFDALKNPGCDRKHTMHNTFKSDVFSLALCFVLAGCLSFNILYQIREVTDMNEIRNAVGKHMQGRYSSKFMEILYMMLEVNEKNRCDFVELNKMLEKL